MKNLVLNLLFASMCGLSFTACADDQKASMAEKAVDGTVKNVTEKAKEVVAVTADASAKSSSSEEKVAEKPATNSAADTSATESTKTDEKPAESTADTSAAESAKTEEQPVEAAGAKEKKGKEGEKEPDCD